MTRIYNMLFTKFIADRQRMLPLPTYPAETLMAL
ncbi:hypothetical protein ABID21_002246 [Pseudorhizobium tarimense]|uniref:Uncharacterized protein n=1 Tax=Pseudorhizobium tarimense TaxID=1079109 RepID=A0ABV2H6I7_9HYPH